MCGALGRAVDSTLVGPLERHHHPRFLVDLINSYRFRTLSRPHTPTPQARQAAAPLFQIGPFVPPNPNRNTTETTTALTPPVSAIGVHHLSATRPPRTLTRGPVHQHNCILVLFSPHVPLSTTARGREQRAAAGGGGGGQWVSEGREVYVRARGKRPARVIAALVAMQVEGGEL